MSTPHLPFQSFPRISKPKLGFVLVLIVSATVGCGSSDTIRSYTPPELERRAYEVDRMVGAIVPVGEKTWFFKLQGKDEAVHEQFEPFLEFLKTVRAPSEAEVKAYQAGKAKREKSVDPVDDVGPVPTWKAPESWIERQPGRLVYRSYRIPNDRFLRDRSQRLKLDISFLPTPEDGVEDRFLLSNINRWHMQYHREAIKIKEIPDFSRKIELPDLQPDGGQAWIVNLSGNVIDRTISEPRVMLPADWKAIPPSGMRAISVVGGADFKADISVSRMPATRENSLEANIGIWKGQAGIEKSSKEVVSRKILVDGVPGDFVELTGAETTIFAVMVRHDDTAWFFKLKAPNAVAMQEKVKFEKFVATAELP